jgi:hypothetical protein
LPVELDEHEVPDLDHLVGARVHQRAAALVRGAVDMHLGTRAARAGVPHLPEVVLLVAEVDVRLGTPTAFQNPAASSSRGMPFFSVASNTGNVQRVGSSFHTPVSSSHAHAIASFLK